MEAEPGAGVGADVESTMVIEPSLDYSGPLVI